MAATSVMRVGEEHEVTGWLPNQDWALTDGVSPVYAPCFGGGGGSGGDKSIFGVAATAV